VAAVAALALTTPALITLGTSATAAPPPAPPGNTATSANTGSDDLPNKAEQKRRELRETAITQVLKGKAKAQKRGASTVVKVGQKPVKSKSRARAGSGGKDQYVELSREKTDKIFVVLAEFGDTRDPNYPDQDTDPSTPGPTKFDGPLHNEIPEPDRAKDNTTNWNADYSRQHFQDLYFSQKDDANSVANFYDKASSGRYTVDGQVTDLVKVKYNEARYGRSNGYPCDGSVCNNSYDLVRDAVNQWAANEKAKGRTSAQIAADLKQFDQWDRYDHDGDGDFNEPDGYIDHFQIVHAGGDQADGDPIQGEDAIWSHRGYAFSNFTSGPASNQRGGAQIGDTGMWVGDYTMQPENGGVSVFCHEFGHDLGLPDQYDTSYGGTNGVNWWSIMAQNRVNGQGEPIGYRANDFAAWDKLQLGWLDYEIVPAGAQRTLELGPHEYNSAKAQGVVIPLPDRKRDFDYGPPASGSKMWWSDSGDNLQNTLTREVDLTGKKTAALSLQARYDIEMDFDYLYVEASTDGGASWTPLDGTVGGKPFIRDGGDAPAVAGSSDKKWVDMSVPLDAYAGKKTTLRFEYRTDGGFAPAGFFADDITVAADGKPVFTDGAENGANGWQTNGFRTVGQMETRSFDNFYIASNRTYEGTDQYMKTGPYNFGDPKKPDWVDHFPYQTGLLVSYWDTSYKDNNTSAHLGEGQILPVDAHPQPIYTLDGTAWRPTVAGYDAPFSLRKADSFTLTSGGKKNYIRGQAANPTFDDIKSYYSDAQPTAGVKLPAVGTGIKVLDQQGTSMKVKVFNTK
jgi:immune inhibitor A